MTIKDANTCYSLLQGILDALCVLVYRLNKQYMIYTYDE